MSNRYADPPRTLPSMNQVADVNGKPARLPPTPPNGLTTRARRKPTRSWGCLIAAGLTSLLGLAIVCLAATAYALIGNPRSAASPQLPSAVSGLPAVAGSTALEATSTRAVPTSTVTRTSTSTPTPWPTPSPEPPSPTADTDGPPAPGGLAPTNDLRIACGQPTSLTLRWDPPSDPSGIQGYRIRVSTSGPDSTEEQLYDSIPASQTELSIQAQCGRTYRWNVLAQDGLGNWGPASPWASFFVDSATSAPIVSGPVNYAHLSCVAQIILRWDAPPDPDGIFGYQVALQEVLGVGYGEATVFGWMVDTRYDATRRTECNRVYRWRVFASDQVQNQSPWSEWAYFIIDAPGQ